MLIARQVFQAQYGRGDELIAQFKELNARMQEEGGEAQRFRILTDASGQFFTVVTEVESLADWEGRFSASMARPWMGEWASRMIPLVQSGSRQFFRVVD